jgi:hypothetical protein
MINSNRDILVLQEKAAVTAEELNRLHTILQQVETPENFCIVHELVDRNRISRRPKKILKETRFYFLRPFRFLINKN